MIKSFSEFINESADSPEDFIKSLALKLIQKIKSAPKSNEYILFSGMEFTEPFAFDLILNIRKKSEADITTDSHFKTLKWEQENYNRLGYAIDANIRTNSGDLLIPELEIHIIIDPGKEPHLYSALHARIIDILTHETNHTDQFSITDRNPFSASPSRGQKRKDAKKSYKYFLLPDEVESMVEGMYASSKHKKIPLDQAFDDYLTPFVKTGYISPQEYQTVIFTWVKFALERYPDANFSKKVEKIVNSI
jgi:hypothetical protein